MLKKNALLVLIYTLILTLTLPVGLVQNVAHAESDSADENSTSDVKLAAGFLMQISSSQDEKLNGAFRIEIEGKIDLPYNVTITAAGMTLAKFRTEIEKVYRPYFKSTANVKVSIKQKRYYVEVRGLVSEPGKYLVKKDSALDELISQAGGLTEDLNSGWVRVEQGGQTHWVDLNDYFKRGNQADLPPWQGGEKVFFQKERSEGKESSLLEESSHKVQILGEIKTPGEYAYRRDADLYSYLIKTGGPSNNADLDKVELIRIDRKTGTRYSYRTGSVGDIKSLEEGDILIFHPLRPSFFEKTLQGLALVAGIVSTVFLAILTVHEIQK